MLGTWSLKSHVVTTAAGVRSTPYGTQPAGLLSYSADGHMQVIGAAGGRTEPRDLRPPDNERLMLYDTMFAYAGTYTVGAGEVTHHVTISWNQAWTGTEQIRAFEVQGDTLTLTTRIADPGGSSETLYTLMWERVRGPR